MHAPTASIEAQPHARTSTDALSRAILAGFAASLTMLLLFLVAYNLARLLGAAPILTAPGLEPLGQWLANLTHNRLIDAGLADVYLAAGVYMAGGLPWAVLYTLVEPRLTGSPLVRGITFAMIPALVSLVVVLPLLGGGLFGLSLGAGPLPTIGNVLLHVVYGAILGLVCGPFGDLDASTLERPTFVEGSRTRTSYEPTAALALVGGLLVGAAIGLGASVVAEASGATLLGASTGGLILWTALLGAVIGLFVGSFLGLGQSAPRHPDA